MNIIRHDDLQPILRSDEWRQIAHAISDLINKQDDITPEQATRAVLYALQVAGLADATCQACKRGQTFVWPVAMQADRQRHLALYMCPDHGSYEIGYGPHWINNIDVSGLT